MTTLNCAQDQSTAPESRRKFNSLRKTGALSKAVRSKLSKSFYSNSSSNNANEKVPNIQNSSESEKISQTESIDKPKHPNPKIKSTKSISTTASPTQFKQEKVKKRSKLCQLL